MPPDKSIENITRQIRFIAVLRAAAAGTQRHNTNFARRASIVRTTRADSWKMHDMRLKIEARAVVHQCPPFQCRTRHQSGKESKIRHNCTGMEWISSERRGQGRGCG